MAQHLVNDLLRWKGLILAARANATESQGPDEGMKGLKVKDVTTLCAFLSVLHVSALMGSRKR